MSYSSVVEQARHGAGTCVHIETEERGSGAVDATSLAKDETHQPHRIVLLAAPPSEKQSRRNERAPRPLVMQCNPAPDVRRRHAGQAAIDHRTL